MLDEVIALFHEPLIGAFIANAHLPVSFQVSPLRTFQESIAVLITADERIFLADVNVLEECLPIDLQFREISRDCFRREFPLLPDHKVFAIREKGRKKDYLFTPELRSTKRFPSRDDYWDYLVAKK